MLAAAALVPDTALLVPGAAGAADVLGAERAAAAAAVRDLVAGGPDRVVVVTGPGRDAVQVPVPGSGIPARPGVPSSGPAPAAAAACDTLRWGPLRPTLAAAGIADDVLRWAAAPVGGHPGHEHLPAAAAAPGAFVTTHDVGASVALLLLARAGWTGTVGVLTATGEASDLREQGRWLTAAGGRLVLLLTGSLSARRGPGAPLAEDDRAPAFDEAALHDLVALGHRTDGRAAAARLSAVPRMLARELAVSAWAPWQVLLGAWEDSVPLEGSLLLRSVPWGATYAVVTWTPAPPPSGPGTAA